MRVAPFETARILAVLARVMGCLIMGEVLAADSTNSLEQLQQAKAAHAGGKEEEAIRLATQAIEAEPKRPALYLARARIYEDTHQEPNALVDYDRALELDPRSMEAWQHRGAVHFKLAQIQESIADWDKLIALSPQQAPYHWQRGIALYYAGRFAEGRQQFELHQTVNPNDVENAVWHFLCVARAVDVQQARALLIPISGDARVPMKQIHELFSGKAKAEDVLKAAQAGNPSPAQLKERLFYAHLYLGLFAEANGDERQAHEHLLKAGKEYRGNDYMGEVARVHLALRWPEKTPRDQ